MSNASQHRVRSLITHVARGLAQDLGVSSDALTENFGDEFPLLVDVINSLLADVSD